MMGTFYAFAAALLISSLLWSFGGREVFAQLPRPNVPPRVVTPGQPELPSSFSMRLENERVTAEIRVTPLQRVLGELAARTGIVFEVSTDLNPPVSLDLYGAEIREAVERIVAGADSIFYYEKDETGHPRIKFVRVFPRGHKVLQGSLMYIGTGTRTVTEESLTPEQALKALESGSVEEKEKAVEVLVALKSDIALEALQKAVADPAVEVQVAAVEGLARLGVRSAVTHLLPLLKHSHPGVRQSAVEAIALLGDAKNVKDLQPLIEDKDGAVAAAAEMAVRKLSAPIP